MVANHQQLLGTHSMNRCSQFLDKGSEILSRFEPILKETEPGKKKTAFAESRWGLAAWSKQNRTPCERTVNSSSVQQETSDLTGNRQ